MLNLTRFDQFYTEGRITRRKWTGTDAQGRETACLLAAIFPEVAKEQSPRACPAGTMWPWLAELTPWIDDAGSDENWPEVVRRFAAILHKLHLLDEAAGERLEAKAKIAALDEASRHYDALKFPDVATAIVTVRALLLRQSENDKPSLEEGMAAAQAAQAAAKAAWAAKAASACAWAAKTAVESARAVAGPEATGVEATRQAMAVAEAAKTAVESAQAAAWATRAGAEAASEAKLAADRIINAILCAFESEITAAGG